MAPNHLRHALVFLLVGVVSTAAYSDDKKSGCFIGAKKAAAMWNDHLLVEESGLLRVDTDRKTEIDDLANTFGTPAAFAFVNDFDGANAFAYQEAEDDYRVMFGIRLLHHMAGTLNPVGNNKIPTHFPSIWNGPIAGVIAHEWAHVLQFKRHVRNHAATAAPIELHADYLAGWYMGMKGERMMIAYEELKSQFYSLGDNDFSNADHHGTPEERARALAKGYELAKTGIHDVNQAFEKGMEAYGLTY
jgi:hypothetical protein